MKKKKVLSGAPKSHFLAYQISLTSHERAREVSAIFVLNFFYKIKKKYLNNLCTLPVVSWNIFNGEDLNLLHSYKHVAFFLLDVPPGKFSLNEVVHIRD